MSRQDTIRVCLNRECIQKLKKPRDGSHELKQLRQFTSMAVLSTINLKQVPEYKSLFLI